MQIKKIEKKDFIVEFDRLVVGRGRGLSKLERQERLKYWYAEFCEWDFEVFKKTIKVVIYSGESGKDRGWFPTFSDMEDAKRAVLASMSESNNEKKEYCGSCRDGSIVYRAYASERDEVQDCIGYCSTCAPENIKTGRINPDKFHKDLMGIYRTPGALAKDRETGNLAPENDPDSKNKVLSPVPISAVPEPMKIVKDTFGLNGKERQRHDKYARLNPANKVIAGVS